MLDLKFNEFKNLVVEYNQQNFLEVSINRPKDKNALNQATIDEFIKLFTVIPNLDKLRFILLSGQGDVFCAGADIREMQAAKLLTREDNKISALKLAKLFSLVNSCLVPVIAFVKGAAIGGGVGLVSVCDHVIADKSAVFGFSEVKLGLVPAVISPYVVDKIGLSQARSLFLTGKVFDATYAYQINLVHQLVDNVLESRETLIKEQLKCGPKAIRIAKKLISDLGLVKDTTEYTASLIANVRVSQEAQEGLSAYLEKKSPNWS